MRVTEQVDAIRAMGADPIRKLVVPRVAATTLALPLLTVFADILGVLGAMIVARVGSGVGMTLFLESMLHSVALEDVMHGLVKTVFFGFLLGLIACHKGLSTTGGTEGVGRATTETVVVTSLVTLCVDFVLTNLLLGFWAMSAPFIEFAGVKKAFGPKVIYEDLTLSVQRGETLTILGGSGTGKSVMLKLLIGLLSADAGSIRFDGTEICGLSETQLLPVRRRISMLFQGGRCSIRSRSAKTSPIRCASTISCRKRRSAIACATSWPWSVCPAPKISARPSSRVGCASASPSPAPSLPIPRCCYTTNRRPAWIPSTPAASTS